MNLIFYTVYFTEDFTKFQSADATLSRQTVASIAPQFRVLSVFNDPAFVKMIGISPKSRTTFDTSRHSKRLGKGRFHMVCYWPTMVSTFVSRKEFCFVANCWIGSGSDFLSLILTTVISFEVVEFSLIRRVASRELGLSTWDCKASGTRTYELSLRSHLSTMRESYV